MLRCVSSIYENDEGEDLVEYDKPSSLFGQFGNEAHYSPLPCSTEAGIAGGGGVQVILGG